MSLGPTVLAAAVSGLLAASSAFAQSSSVQLYGRANLGLDSYSADGARDATATGANCTAGTAGCTAGSGINRESRLRVFDNSSRVGLRGTEDLGNGLKAIFQIETGVNVDNGSNTGQGGQGNGSTGLWASRDSYVGFDSNFGRLTFGRQSIYNSNGVNAQFAANYINTEVPWTDGRAFGRVRVPASRQSNVVMYTTSTLAGLNGSLYYSPNAQEAVQTSATSDTDGSVWGATARGTWGPFYAQLDYVSNEGNTPAIGVRSDQSAWKLGASWGYMPGARLGLIGTLAYDN
jgi:predicted porin